MLKMKPRTEKKEKKPCKTILGLFCSNLYVDNKLIDYLLFIPHLGIATGVQHLLCTYQELHSEYFVYLHLNAFWRLICYNFTKL